MRYVTAAIACLCLIFAYALVRVFVFGTTQAEPVSLFVLFIAMVFIWRGITRRAPERVPPGRA